MVGCGQATPGQPLHKGSRLTVGSNTNCSSSDLDTQYYIKLYLQCTYKLTRYIHRCTKFYVYPFQKWILCKSLTFVDDLLQICCSL